MDMNRYESNGMIGATDQKYQLLVTADFMHNWPHYCDQFLAKQLPEDVRKTLFEVHREHSRGLNVREAAEMVCRIHPDHLKMAF